MASYHKALPIKPDYAKAHNNLGNAFKELGRLDEVVASYHKALTIKPDFAVAHNNLTYTEQYRTGVTPNKLGTIHALWEKQFGALLQREWRDHGNIPDLERRLRIGLVSPDLGRHPVGYFVVSLLARISQTHLGGVSSGADEPGCGSICVALRQSGPGLIV